MPVGDTPTAKRSVTEGPSEAVKRLMREVEKARLGADQTKGTVDEFVAEPDDESDLFTWTAEIRGFHLSSDAAIARFGNTLRELGFEGIKLGLSFPKDYPASPAFVYVKKPRINAPYVFLNGGMCMQILSREGWSPATTVQSLLMAIRSMWMTPTGLHKKAGSQLSLRDSITKAESQEENTEEEAKGDFNAVKMAHPDWF